MVLQCDLEPMMDFWLVRDYLTTFREAGMPMAELAGHLGAQRIEPVPIPHDCRDGFLSAYWRRPQAYLDQRVRDGISVFRLLPPEGGADALEEEIFSGRASRWTSDTAS